MTEHHGNCHCGQLRLTLYETPSEVAECNCSICRRTAGLWHYCVPDAVTVLGAGIAYQQGDCALDLWHCPTCGCTTHWTSTDPTYLRMGINLRMFDPALWGDLPHRLVDGASY
ncbi:GFA family protein [Sphingomonas sp. ac-8]|uniref:GFA family protein n=1 Tax=Sphingomonas sp. ac-8 TaxID=3242977 RepID=UPI003A80AFCA